MPEFGIRLALGSTPRQIVSLVLGQAARMVVAGVLLGAAGAWLVSSGLTALLFGVTGRDPASYALAVAAVVALGTLASLLPAWRAASIGPLRALRGE